MPSVLWHCWLGVRKSTRPVKKWVMSRWCGYLSAARCRLFAYGPADATASQNPHHLLPRLNPDWFHLSGTGLPRLSWKSGRWTGVVVVAVVATWLLAAFRSCSSLASVIFCEKWSCGQLILVTAPWASEHGQSFVFRFGGLTPLLFPPFPLLPLALEVGPPSLLPLPSVLPPIPSLRVDPLNPARGSGRVL